jgi:hypothetical protein
MSESIQNDGGPAFPRTGEGVGNPRFDEPGMTLRDYFAAKALQSVIMVCAHDTREPEQTLEQYFAKFSYELADAMLKARAVKHV